MNAWEVRSGAWSTSRGGVFSLFEVVVVPVDVRGYLTREGHGTIEILLATMILSASGCFCFGRAGVLSLGSETWANVECGDFGEAVACGLLAPVGHRAEYDG